MQIATWRGGGYFLKWSGYGTVIDPGVSFVTNFLSHGFHAKEVHHVFTTHCHVDHTADLMPLQSLVHEYNEWASEDDQHDLLHFWDMTTHGDRARVHMETKSGEESPHELRPPSAWHQRLRTADLEVQVADSHHHCDGAVSLRFTLNSAGGGDPFSIGLSSDAGRQAYKDNGTTTYRDAAEELGEFFEGCQLIVLHFSKTTEADLRGHREEETHHLGYTGCRRIIEETDADLYVIAEFSGEMGDYRYEVVKNLALETRREERIIPADIGLTVCLPGDKHKFLGIRCSQCDEFHPVADVRTVKPPFPFGPITYVCPDCTR